jgi:hypothetical protein
MKILCKRVSIYICPQSMKKGVTKCVDSFQLNFFFGEITIGILYINLFFIFWNKFLYFLSFNYKICMKIHHVSKVLNYVFKALKNTCVHVIFLFQKSFLIIKCPPNCFNIFMDFNIFHKKGSMCLEHSKNKNTSSFLDFDTWTF